MLTRRKGEKESGTGPCILWERIDMIWNRDNDLYTTAKRIGGIDRLIAKWLPVGFQWWTNQKKPEWDGERKLNPKRDDDRCKSEIRIPARSHIYTFVESEVMLGSGKGLGDAKKVGEGWWDCCSSWVSFSLVCWFSLPPCPIVWALGSLICYFSLLQDRTFWYWGCSLSGVLCG